MRTIIKFAIYYIACLLCVSACWVGLEYILEGAVHSSDVDGLIAVIFSYFITEKFVSLEG